jgi:Ca-activated chloride channel homolog
VTDLRREDFRVFDDGRPVPVAVFANARRPARILLLLDTSSSMTGSLPNLQSAAHAFLSRLAPDDVVRLGTFSDRLRLSPTFLPVGDESLARLPIAPGSNQTVLYDALAEACDAFDGDDRRVIVVVSDGADTASSASARIVMERATVAGVAIYAIGLNSRFVERGRSVVRAPDPALREIAEDTGGGYVFGEKSSDLNELFAPIIDELHQQYIIGFTPADADGRIHSLVIRVNHPAVEVRARRHYFARR